MDTRCPSLLEGKGQVCQYGTDICLRIDSKLCASMIDEEYDGFTIFSKCAIIGCRCSCKAGSWGEQHHTCTHIQTRPFQTSVLLFDGLAEHTLVELAELWKDDSHFAEWPNEEKGELLHALTLLKQASCMDTQDSTCISGTQTISGLLKDFSVGTENVKFGPPPPTTLQLGPLWDLRLQQPSKAAKIKMEKEKGSLLVWSSETTSDSARDDETTRSEENRSSRSDNVTDVFANGPDYSAVSALVKTVTETVLDLVGHKNEKKMVACNVDRDEMIGYQLLDL